nr:slime protein [Eoperipatus sp.]
MGAKYKPDWEDSCTHLICAFANTPKHRQVQKLGGQVVRKEWIVECYKKKRKLPWKMFRLDGDSEEEEDDEDNDQTYEEGDDEEDEDEEEIRLEKKYSKKHVPKPGPSNLKKTSPKKTTLTFTEKKPSPKKLKLYDEEENEENSKKYSSEEDSGDDTEDEIRKVREEENKKPNIQHTKSDNEYEGSTDEDAELEKKNVKSLSKTIVENGNSSSTKESIFPLPNLPSFFKEKSFFFFGNFDDATRKLLKRYIIAFGGKLENSMDQKVSFVITASDWDEQFEQALNENDSLTFVRPQWIFKCKDKGKFVPYQPYVVVPKESSD